MANGKQRSFPVRFDTLMGKEHAGGHPGGHEAQRPTATLQQLTAAHSEPERCWACPVRQLCVSAVGHSLPICFRSLRGDVGSWGFMEKKE